MERMLCSPEDLEDDDSLDLGRWAGLAKDDGLDLAKKIVSHLIETSKLEIHNPSSETNQKAVNADIQHLNLHLRLRPEASSEPRTLWTISNTNEIPSSLAVQARNWTELNSHIRLKTFGKAAQYHLPTGDERDSGNLSSPKGPRGKIWWITDTSCEKPSRTSRELVSIELLIMLAHLYHLFRDSENHQGGGSAEIEETSLDFARARFEEFVLVFANPSNPPPQNFWQFYDRHKCLQFHFHLRHFSPGTTPIPAQGLLFSPERQTAKIRYFEETDKTKKVLHLEERALSLSLTMRPSCGTFFLFVVGDKGVPVTARGYTDGYREGCTISAADFKKQPWEKIDIDPWNSGKRAGVDHFLVSLSALIEAWHSSWDATLDVVDSSLRFKMSHTLEEDRIDDFMFDKSPSMDLSRQCFTVIQILRIASEWIDASVTDWDKMKEGIVETFEFLAFFGATGYDMGRPLEEQLNEITRLLTRKAKQLKDRIHIKSEEVKSLRDGLFNATSLKEAKAGMELNRAIYMFTAVTIIYTPLGFMTGFWALPIFNTTSEGEDMHPSASALVATFLIIPIATYLVCVWVAWRYASSDSPVKKWFQEMLPRSSRLSEPQGEYHRDSRSPLERLRNQLEDLAGRVRGYVPPWPKPIALTWPPPLTRSRELPPPVGSLRSAQGTGYSELGLGS